MCYFTWYIYCITYKYTSNIQISINILKILNMLYNVLCIHIFYWDNKIEYIYIVGYNYDSRSNYKYVN